MHGVYRSKVYFHILSHLFREQLFNIGRGRYFEKLGWGEGLILFLDHGREIHFFPDTRGGGGI